MECLLCAQRLRCCTGSAGSLHSSELQKGSEPCFDREGKERSVKSSSQVLKQGPKTSAGKGRWADQGAADRAGPTQLLLRRWLLSVPLPKSGFLPLHFTQVCCALWSLGESHRAFLLPPSICQQLRGSDALPQMSPQKSVITSETLGAWQCLQNTHSHSIMYNGRALGLGQRGLFHLREQLWDPYTAAQLDLIHSGPETIRWEG